jgi:ribosome-binding protein aMBF1 (putative translation factor)
VSQHETIDNPHGGTEGAAQGTRRDPFGLNLPRRPDWEMFGVVSDDLDLDRDVAAGAAVELRRSGLVAGVVGLASAGLAVAWLSRAAADGGALAWSLTGFLAVVALAYLTAFVDARVPLAVVDAQGVRMRLGRTWQGLPWESVDRVELAPRQGLLRDGRLVVVPFDADEVVGALDGSARWHAFLARRWYGGSFALPVGLSTRVTGADDLAVAVRTLADPEVPVQVHEAPVEVHEAPAEVHEAPAEAPAEDLVEAPTDPVEAPVAQTEATTVVEPVVEPVAVDATPPADDHARGDAPSPVVAAAQRLRPWAATVLARLAERRETGRATAEDLDDGRGPRQDDLGDDSRDDFRVGGDQPDAVPASPTPAPLREPRAAVRAEVLRREEAVLDLPASARVEGEEPAERELPEAAAYLRRPAEPGLAAYETRDPLDEATGPLGVVATEPVVEPVVGPVLTEARRRLGLSVDQVAERTRIRPHVIEAIEVDDFGPCGGDFYARGHLRTLGRVLGVEPQPLVEEYDERYAAAPIDARRVFEAELATVPGGSLRATRGGPNWSVLVAAVMSVVLLWAVAQFLFERPAGSEGTGGEQAGLTSGSAATPLDVELVAGEQAADVTVRDAAGDVVWQGRLEPGASQAVRATPPVRISSSDGGVAAAVDGRDASPLGEAGEPVQRSLS